MAIGDRIVVETYGACTECFNSGYRTPVPEQHTEDTTAWFCYSCESVYWDRAIFETKLSDAEFTF